MRRLGAILAAALLLAVGAPATAQDEPDLPEPLEVGARAPDFTLPATTRHGALAEPISLSDLDGEVVVLAFFFRARTKG